MRYQSKIIQIEATQWFKNGDHPKDDVLRPFEDTGEIPTEPREGAVVRYFRHPLNGSGTLCPNCMYLINSHGFIDTRQGGHKVCPSDWIITDLQTGETYPCKDDVFQRKYFEIPSAENIPPISECKEQTITLEDFTRIIKQAREYSLESYGGGFDIDFHSSLISLWKDLRDEK